MASLTLDTLWLHDHADLSDFRVFPFMSALSRTPQVQGSRRKYGTGRLRSYAQAGVTRDWSVALVAQTQSDMDWLEAHLNRTLLARDDRGHRIFAVYYEIPIMEHAYNKEGDLTLNLLEVTATLAV